MAYPTISGPYGLRPINLIGGQVFAGATRQRRIASGAASIGFGDPVIFVSDGTIAVSTSTTTAPATGFAGVFLGCQFVSSVTVNRPSHKLGSLAPQLQAIPSLLLTSAKIQISYSKLLLLPEPRLCPQVLAWNTPTSTTTSHLWLTPSIRQPRILNRLFC